MFDDEVREIGKRFDEAVRKFSPRDKGSRDIFDFRGQIEDEHNSEILQRISLEARKKINEEKRKSPDMVTDEELTQYGLALQALYNRRDPDYDTKVRSLVQEIMDRPINEVKLAILMSFTRMHYKGDDYYRGFNRTPFFSYYRDTLNKPRVNESGLAHRNILTEDEDKFQTFIEATDKAGFGRELLQFQISRNNILGRKENQAFFDKSLIAIMKEEVKSLNAGCDVRVCGEEMLKTIQQEQRGLKAVFEENPEVAAAFLDLREACAESYKRELEEYYSIIPEQERVQKPQREM